MGRIAVAVTNPVTATPVKSAVFSTTGPLMDPTEWTPSYSANDAEWLFFKGPSYWIFKHVDGKYLIYGMAFLKNRR